MQNTEYVAKMLEFMGKDGISDEQFNTAMDAMEAKLKSKGIEVEALPDET